MAWVVDIVIVLDIDYVIDSKDQDYDNVILEDTRPGITDHCLNLSTQN